MVGFTFAYSIGIQRAFLDALPQAHRGQGFALLGTGMMTMQGLGPVAAGAVAQSASIPAALAGCGVATVMTALVVAIVHKRRTLVGPPPSDERQPARQLSHGR